MIGQIFTWLWRRKWLLIIAVLPVWFFYGDIKTLVMLKVHEETLPHYQFAQQVDESTFDSLPSEVWFSTDDTLVNGYGTIYDQFTDDYYEILAYKRNNQHEISLRKYHHATSSDETGSVDVIIPSDRRFYFNGGMACFSCGCDCYADRTLLVTNGNFFFVAEGRENAMPVENQGVYVLRPGDSWKKLTPKLDLFDGSNTFFTNQVTSKIKIYDKGCSLAYELDGGYYTLDICTN